MLTRMLVVFLAVIFLIVCIYFCFFSDSFGFGKTYKETLNQTTSHLNGQNEEQSGDDTEKAITLEQFNAVETGMSLEEMVATLGSEGTVISESKIGEGEYEITTIMYQYTGSGSFGANANFTVQNGKVVSKAQFGLE